MLLLTNNDVVQVLTMEKCLEAVEEATRRLGRGQLVRWDGGRNVEVGKAEGLERVYTLRLRPVLDLADGTAILRLNSWVTVTVEQFGMPRRVIAPLGESLNVDTSQKPGYPQDSEKSGWLFLFDMRAGKLLAIVQERDVQVIRVGGVAALNAKYFARHDARSIGLIGSGWMARSVLMGHCLVRDIRTVKVFSPNAKNQSAFAAEMKKQLAMEIIPVASAEEAVRDADIVVSATNTAEPTFDPAWVAQGAHVYCVTGAEYDERMVEKADVVSWTFPKSIDYDAAKDFVTSLMTTGEPQEAKLAARKRGGQTGYRMAGWRLLEKYASKRVFLTDLVEGKAAGRSDAKQITFSPSPAGASAAVVRFAVLVPTVYKEAKQKRMGQELPDEWFDQQIDTYPTYRLR